MSESFLVSVSIEQATQVIDNAIISGSITGERLDSYRVDAPGGACLVLVYEKHYWRASNRLTLTVVLDSFTGTTRVHCVGGGGGEGLLNIDWGASASFADAAERALEPYRV